MSLKLRFPCEIVVRYITPVVKCVLAQELVNSYGLSQVKAAEILDVTQPAICMYLRSEAAIKEVELKESLEEVKLTAKGLAEDIYRGRVTQVEAMRRICSLCVKLRSNGPVCEVHKKLVPVLRAETCCLCVEDLTLEKRMSLEEIEVLENVKRALKLIEETPEFSYLIPEIGTNIAMAKKDARTINDVVGVQGRVHSVRGRPQAAGAPSFGGSSHVASAVLTAMKYDSDVRAAINIKYEPEIVNICKEMGLKASFYDRAEEPPEIKAADGKTIPWGIAKAVERVGAVPDVVYDFGDVGKEPMLFLLGASASDVAYVAIRIAREYWKRKSGMNV